MDKSNLELFKQAISEGLSEKIDSVANSCNDEIVYSEGHKLAMRTIVYGEVKRKRSLSPKMKWFIAILVAATLLLASCGIIFHNEIREVFEGFYASITFDENGSICSTIENIYELTYLPEGYHLKSKEIRLLRIEYEYVNENNDIIKFQQRILDGSDFTIDSESGYSKILEIEEYDIYYRYTERHHHYVWTDGKYSFTILSNQKITHEEIVLIINGMK